MSAVIQYELHSVRMGSNSDPSDDVLHGVDEEASMTSIVPLRLDAHRSALAWVGADGTTGELCAVQDEADGVAGFAVVHRRLAPALGMFAGDSNVLVNAVPALGFHVLGPRDCLVLAAGVITYVTERFFPYVGLAREVHLGQRCPCCKIDITRDTHVVTCRCGCVYHNESAQSHPELKTKDRLNCFEKVRVCLSCNRPLTLDPALVWDPGELA